MAITQLKSEARLTRQLYLSEKLLSMNKITASDSKYSVSVPLDVLLLLVLVPAQVHAQGISFLLVIPLFFYILLELWHSPALSNLSYQSSRQARLAFMARFFLLLLMISSAVIVPSFRGIFDRLAATYDESGYSETYANIHDGAIQVEYALEFLSNGRNPYEETYENTPLMYYGFSGIDLPINPAINHFVYLPGFLITSFPVYKMFAQFDLPYDQRWIYLVAFFALILLLPTLVSQPMHKLALLAAIGLNPLVTGPVILGMNDIIVFLLIFLTALTLSKQKILLSAIFLGIACTFKQSAWFILPFYALFIYNFSAPTRRIQELFKVSFIIALIMIIGLLPFVAWNPSSFIEDVFTYPSGGVNVNYPIRGYTIGVLLLGAGIIASPLDDFPFSVLQMIFGLPLLVFTLRYQQRQNLIGVMLLCAGIFIWGIGLVSRFFQNNYVGFVIMLITMGLFIAMSENPPLEQPVADSISADQ
jgi:hypothetical protein